MKEASKLNLKDFEPTLFTVPCSICDKPMIFTHKESNWRKEVKPWLCKAWGWFHTVCEKKQGSK
jgi:hypothetical protein